MNGIPLNPSICFGVPSLDDLFGTFGLSHRSYGIPAEGAQANLTLVGPDGSGKSLLAFHLASRYAADSFSRSKAASKPEKSIAPPMVIYISTDLSTSKAGSTWRAFRLDRPNLREIPFYHGTVESKDNLPVGQEEVDLHVALLPLDPSRDDAPESLARYILASGPPNQNTAVGFIDLIRHPVGDLWSFTSRLLASLPQRQAVDHGVVDQHLVVIDNVDGFEVLMGEVNAYGDRSSVRARIMQAVRAAYGKAHLVFLSEQGGAGAASLADISDVVVRLRMKEELGYKYRAIEIEKARAQAIHRGDHYLLIRTGGGSTTGTQENPDDPRTANAYLQVIPSLSTLSRRNMNEPAGLKPGPPVNATRRAGFGLHALDELCGCAAQQSGKLFNDQEGVKYGTLSAILGDSNTHKTPLAEKFILRGFELFARNLNLLYKTWRDHPGTQKKEIDEIVQAIGKRLAHSSRGAADSKGDFPNELLDKYREANADQQVRFLSQLLLQAKSGAEQIWDDPEKFEAEISSLKSGNMSPALAFVCGSWAARLLKKRLRQLEEPVNNTVDPELVKACLPEPAFNNRFCQRLWEPEEINGEELLEAATELWWADFQDAAKDPNSPSLSHQYELVTAFLKEDGTPRVDLVRQAITRRRTQPSEEAPTAGAEALNRQPPRSVVEEEARNLKASNKERWREKYNGLEFDALDFIEARFPGSSDYLTREKRKELRRQNIAIAHFLPEEFKRMFIGGAIRHIDSYRQNDEDLKAWLKRLGIWPGQPDEEPLRFGQNLLTFARHAVISDQNAMTDLIGHLSPPEPARSFELEWVISRSVPNLSDYAKLGDPGTSSEAFAEWLFDFSPNTHPYAFNSGKQRLKSEIETLRTEDIEDRPPKPTFCSAMVAAILQLVRLGKLSLSKHLDDELRSRRDATETLPNLSSWVDTYLSYEEKDEPGKECRQAIVGFCSQLAAGKLEDSRLQTFVKALSKRRGLDLRLPDLDGHNLPPEEGLKVHRLLEDPGLLPEKRLEVCRLLLESAARFGLCDGPVVLITTNDTRWRLFRDKYARWLRRFLKAEGYDDATARRFQNVAQDHLREWLIIRRLEVHYLATATLSAIIRRCVVTGQALLLASPPLEDSPGSGSTSDMSQSWMADINARRERCWNLRLVIDGLTTLRNTYPNIDSDPLFLPALRFFIGSENLTGIVVASQSGRPDNTGADRFEREVTDLFLNQIRTWRVRFYGELRVAVTTVPPAYEGSARIREVLIGPHGELEIDPHFELYKGLETDTPERVGLEIRLIGDTQVWQAYRATLNEVFADVFAEADPDRGTNQVVLAEPSQSWTEKLRDFARLHRGTHLDRTLILQVDEFWGFQRSDALRNAYRFLNAECHTDRGGEGNDPLEMFQATLAGPEAASTSRRFQRFVWNGYHDSEKNEHWARDEHQSVDRVPFLWDFGFMLCHREAWESAGSQHLHIAGANYRQIVATSPEWKPSVNDIWQSFKKIPGLGVKPGEKAIPATLAHLGVNESSLSTRSWRLFMEAAVSTASHHTLSSTDASPAFDLAVRGGESLSCLILEIWASEVYRKFERDTGWAHALKDAYFARFTRRSWAPALTRGLIGLIAEPETRGSLKIIYGKALASGRLPELARHSLDFFKALLLIGEAMSPASFVKPKNPHEMEPRPVSSEAIAARHWYGTACEFFENCPTADRFVPVRLPGHFSVRGDWFLAVAKGSHSSLLADRALDLLSSRRGNFDRLRLGLGLPVREVDPNTGLNPRTRLTGKFENGRKDWIRYRDLKNLGADGPPADDFYWLWRSSLGDYDAQDRVFQQGIVVLINWWNNLKSSRGTDWKTGFHLYDAIDKYQAVTEETLDVKNDRRRRIFDESFAVNSLWEFPELCDELIQALKRATPRRSKANMA